MKSEMVGVLIFLVIFGCSVNPSPNKDEKQEIKSRSEAGSRREEKICLLALNEIDSILLKKLSTDLEKIFGRRVEISKNLLDLEFAYNPERRQYYSSVILEKLPNIAPEACERLLALVDVDLYVPELNFVFGEADIEKKMAVISTKRLKPEYYGLPEDTKLFGDRVLKESVHELGHTYGLGHCPDKKCVMHFSNSLIDTDIKSPFFCEDCKKKLMNLEG